MNPELPPISLAQPLIRKRRRSRQGFPQTSVSREDRRKSAKLIHDQRSKLDSQVRTLTQEQRRALFVRLKHDRPLTQNDLAGTDLKFLSAPGTQESLAFPMKNSFTKFDERIEQFKNAKAKDEKGAKLATALKSIDLADPKDRLSEELFDLYDEWTAKDHLIYEIEIASFAHVKKQERELNSILSEIKESLRYDGALFEHERSGSGARVVIRSSGRMFQEFVKDPKWWRRIVFFDTRPKFETFTQTLENFSVSNVSISKPPSDAETICVIDSGVAAGNPFLKPCLRKDISRSYVYGCSPTEDARGHGSGVASLSAYYDIDISSGGVNEAKAFVCSARIMTDQGELDTLPLDDPRDDAEQDARLLTSILREIVEHYQPHGVRIFVLSFQICGHIWSKASRRLVARNAWAARTIDQLSKEHDVVFVAITGNILSGTVSELLEEQKYPGYLQSPLAKVVDPGPASLAVTVGSIAHSDRVVAAASRPLANVGQPSPFTRTGPGFGDSVKPDVVERGGNWVFDETSGTARGNAGTDVIMASGKRTPAIQHSNGTSFAAPRVAHHLAVILRDLRALDVDPSAPLLRALLAASATRIESQTSKDVDLATSGYGLPDARKALDCSKHSALLFWQGNMTVDQSAIFRIHVPNELAGFGGKKRLTVAVATSPPVQSWGLAEYLGTRAQFRLFRGDKPIDAIMQQLQRDNEEDNIAVESNIDELDTVYGINRRSKGTLQLDIHEWSKHESDYSDDDYSLGVTLRRASWCKTTDEIPVAVIVRVEDTTGQCELVYERVRARNSARVQQQQTH